MTEQMNNPQGVPAAANPASAQPEYQTYQAPANAAAQPAAPAAQGQAVYSAPAAQAPAMPQMPAAIKQITDSPIVMGAVKVGAIAGACLLGVAVLFSLIFALYVGSLLPEQAAMAGIGTGSLFSSFLSMCFGGGLAFSGSAVGMSFNAGVSMMLLTPYILGLVLAIIVGSRIAKSNTALAKMDTKSFWLGVASFGVTVYLPFIILVFFTSASIDPLANVKKSLGNLPVEGLGGLKKMGSSTFSVGGTILLPLLFVVLTGILLFAILASRLGANHLLPNSLVVKFKYFVAPGVYQCLTLFIVLFVITAPINLILLIVKFSSTISVVGVFMLLIALAGNGLFIMPALCIGNVVSSGTSVDGFWTGGAGYIIYGLIMMFIALIVGVFLRHQVRGYDINPIAMVADTVVYAVFGVFVLFITTASANTGGIPAGPMKAMPLSGFGLWGGTPFIFAVWGAVFAVIHIYLLPILQGNTDKLGRSLYGIVTKMANPFIRVCACLTPAGYVIPVRVVAPRPAAPVPGAPATQPTPVVPSPAMPANQAPAAPAQPMAAPAVSPQPAPAEPVAPAPSVSPDSMSGQPQAAMPQAPEYPQGEQ